ncbi:TIR domain-containing protein [Chaetoceros tenuissimus]|uniref:TIR domain-containing protein n=1 Tax=Chaetoceros tenuissimus TaxID=426638 RepID=A0AAD3D272_9STRA|nr:TIR domain-containing protein [Chaetoceros tenuissimus]
MRTEVVDGLLTLFYDGSKNLFNANLYTEKNRQFPFLTEETQEQWNLLSDECKKYWKERWSWEQVIIEDDVEVIPLGTFAQCKNIKRVIFADTVIRIEKRAFSKCWNLIYIKLSVNLEYIGSGAFRRCNLSSVFFPPSCREISSGAFAKNKNLLIFTVPHDVEIGYDCIKATKLLQLAPRQFKEGRNFHYTHYNSRYGPGTMTDIQEVAYDTERVNAWVKNINAGDTYVLHRACASCRPLKEDIYDFHEESGFKGFSQKNEIDISPSTHLKENPHTDLSDMELLRDYFSKKFNF